MKSTSWLILCTFQTFQQATPKTFHLRWRRRHRRPRSHHNRIRHTWRRRVTSRMMSMRSSKKMTKTAPRDVTLITRRPTHKTSGKRRLEQFFRELKSSSWNRRLTWNGKFWWWFKPTEHKITIISISIQIPQFFRESRACSFSSTDRDPSENMVRFTSAFTDWIKS